MKQEPPDYGYDTPEYNDMDYHQSYYPYQNNHMDYTEHNHQIKPEPQDDGYNQYYNNDMYNHMQTPPSLPVTPKKRGRPRKIRPEEGGPNPMHNPSPMGYPPLTDTNGIKVVKERKKHDRFNGMSEEEVSQRTLPDHLAPDLDIVIVGINPGLFAAYKGHHYAGPGNHFWKCLFLSGLIPEPMTADDDYKLLNMGIGFTNIVERATKGSADLTRKEIKLGGQILLEKLQKFKPKIAVFNGKYIYEVFSGKKDFNFGRQPEFVEGTNTYMWVMPSSSARCAQLPRAADKVPFYAALKKFRDYLKGTVQEINESELVFSNFKMKNFMEPEIKQEPEEKDGECSYNFNNPNLMDNTNVKKEPVDPPPKKKRGRPKKIKTEDAPQKIKDEKPATPIKIKEEKEDFAPQSENSNLSNHCFSPPAQASPGMQNQYQMYQGPQYNPSPQSPHFHNSPMSAQSPQPFQHSDLSSDLRAAISSDSHQQSSFSPYFTNSESEAPKQEEKPYSSPNKNSYHNYETSNYDEGYSKKPVTQDVSSRSLSGLESLIDQMRNDTDEDSTFHEDRSGSHYSPGSYTPNGGYMQPGYPSGSAPQTSEYQSGNYEYPQMMVPPSKPLTDSNQPRFTSLQSENSNSNYYPNYPNSNNPNYPSYPYPPHSTSSPYFNPTHHYSNAS
uniref:G/T mismatch-specific thymine DNA glycosylase n=1 Tax=Lygus hesperus TaxID=30085 RepID=A0A0K8TIY5_LYGHE